MVKRQRRAYGAAGGAAAAALLTAAVLAPAHAADETVYANRKVRLVTEVRELGDHIAIQYRVRLPDGRLFGHLENEGGTLFFGLADNEGSEVCDGKVRAR